MNSREALTLADVSRAPSSLFNRCGMDRTPAAALMVLMSGLVGVFSAHGQVKAPAAPVRIEPGLEMAIQWKWRVVPAEEKEWGLPLPESSTPAPSGTPLVGGSGGKAAASAAAVSLEPRPAEYAVQKGDALILIGKKFGMTAYQLKTFNGLAGDTIRIGQVLKIPTVEELNTLPAQAPPPEPKPKPEDKVEEKLPAAPKAEPVVEIPGREDLITQVFLDREQFSTGPIDGNAGPTLAAVSQLYRNSHEDAQNMESFRQKVRNTVIDPLTRYTLKAEDFRFIAPPAQAGKVSTGKKSSKASGELPPPTYEELIAADSLVYRSAWEFAAERFHCEESFLRSLNPRIKGNPVAGTQFQVPDVVPFEVEHVFEGDLQPVADPAHPVVAALVEISRLEISRDGKLIAVMPLALARPDLRGRGSWTILDAIPRPKLATLQELKDPPKAAVPVAPGVPVPGAPVAPALPANPATAPAPVLTTEQFLAAGPNNPVGIVWINLAKAKSRDPLPYGLHGTSIPSRMKTQEGLGGIRLANWDVARAVRLLPAGTPLQWK